jgi:mannose/cellobiose epimerase-like protein (N-acyl-D-glucosamine 2-epimerase family)
MNNVTKGAHSNIDILSQKLFLRWVPKWYDAFIDQERGGVYERVGHSFKPVLTGQRRLLTLCRQIAIYSDCVSREANRNFRPDLEKLFDHMLGYFYRENGRWIFSINDQMDALDESEDLYSYAFVIFSLAHYYRATRDKRAQELALSTLSRLDHAFRMPELKGLAEGLAPDGSFQKEKPRRHETHMHLFEGCLFAYEIFQDEAFRIMADEMADLFTSYFFDMEGVVLSEYYTDTLKPVASQGHIITEPGHYCEWIWLLKKHAGILGDKEFYDPVCKKLINFANKYGWDEDYGGIYDELDPEGNVVRDTKRIWPFTEALKANVLMLDVKTMDKNFIKQRLSEMLKTFLENYMSERGFWTEWLDRNLQPQTDYMPGTTPYHVYFGITEAKDVLQMRGKSRSVIGHTFIKIYAIRRNVSQKVKHLKKRFGSISGNILQ